jgi:phage shock protein PspC (stress-responsive transcriptional regulator)
MDAGMLMLLSVPSMPMPSCASDVSQLVNLSTLAERIYKSRQVHFQHKYFFNLSKGIGTYLFLENQQIQLTFTVIVCFAVIIIATFSIYWLPLQPHGLVLMQWWRGVFSPLVSWFGRLL